MNSREKGKRGEREWRDELRAQGYDARRGQQFSGSPDSPDVVSSLPIHFEVKRVQALQLRAAIAQASRDANGKPWAVAHKWNGGEWLVIQLAVHWFKAIRGDYAGIETTAQFSELVKRANALRDYLLTCVVAGFDVPDEIWTPFESALDSVNNGLRQEVSVEPTNHTQRRD